MLRYIAIFVLAIVLLGCDPDAPEPTRQLVDTDPPQESATRGITPTPTVIKVNSATAVSVAPTSTPTPTQTPTPSPTPTRVPTLQPTLSPTPVPVTQNEPLPVMNVGGSGYSCNCAKLCSQMASCDEAYFQLNSCGCGKRDGDNDGVPCESICQ